MLQYRIILTSAQYRFLWAKFGYYSLLFSENLYLIIATVLHFCEMRNKKLRDNISFNEFLALANREPDINPVVERYYYRLEVTEIGEGSHIYPIFHVGQTHIVDFPTYSSAVYYMKKYVAAIRIYRMRITQIPLDIEETGRGAQWLYDGDGNLIDCTIVHKAGKPEETHFFGRELAKQRFAPWEIVELLQGNDVKLVQVAAPVRTPGECWRIYQEVKSEYGLNYQSDSYGILTDDAGTLEFALATTLMKPRFAIPQDIYTKINSRYDTMIMSALRGKNPTLRVYQVKDDQ